jgi:hypothetical protein
MIIDYLIIWLFILTVWHNVYLVCRYENNGTRRKKPQQSSVGTATETTVLDQTTLVMVETTVAGKATRDQAW